MNFSKTHSKALLSDPLAYARRIGTGLLTAAVIATVGAVSFAGAVAAQVTIESARGGGQHLGEVVIPVNKSQVMRSQQPFSRIVIGNPEIADVVPLTNRSAYILGKSAGSTSLMVYGANERLLAVADLVVGFDLQAIKAKLYEVLPDEKISVRSVGGRVLLEGQVTDAPAAATAMRVANAYAPDAVDNGLSVGPSQQVLLEVVFAEVNKDFGKALGIKTGVNYTSGDGDFSFNIDPAGDAFVTASSVFTGGITATLGAFSILSELDFAENRGLGRRLAEPKLMVLSGETASFLAGGEFPIQVTQPGTDNFTIEFKEFGVSLSFTPTVLSDGLISLRVRPEVSNIATFDEGTGVNTRRADTTVELRDGQSFSIAGLYQNSYDNNVNQLPWLGDVPVLGALFRSTEYQESETELVIIVTPRLVQPAKSPSDLKLPTDIYNEPNEAELFLLGKIMGDDATTATAATGGAGGMSGPSGYILK